MHAQLTNAAITVQPAPPPPPTPALSPRSALNITPRMFALGGRRIGGRCRPANSSTNIRAQALSGGSLAHVTRNGQAPEG